MDMGEEGILSSMDYWDSISVFPASDEGDVSKTINYLGIHRSEDERLHKKIILHINNFKIGFLAYTYGTNNIPLPENKSYLVSLAEPETMAAEISALRPLCDYLAVSIHWGEEYSEDANTYQEELAGFFADHSVDLVIGHHPHVLGPIDILNRSDGKNTVVFYSLGNFLSAHVSPIKEVFLGGLMYVKLKKTGDTVETEEIGLIPVITHYDFNRTVFGIYPLSEYSEELAEKHWRRFRDSELTHEFFIKKARDRYGSRLILDNPFLPQDF